MNYFITFSCGFFGGSAASLLTLASRALAEDMPTGGYYVALIIFGMIGGGVAVVYKELITHKAFLLGISAPALIMTAGTVTDKNFLPVSSAYAQDLIAPTITGVTVSNRASLIKNDVIVVVPIEPKEFGGLSVEANAQLNFRTPDKEGSAHLYNLAEFIAKYGPYSTDDTNSWYAIVPRESTTTSLLGSVTTFSQVGGAGGAGGALDVWKIETEEVEIPAAKSSVKFKFRKEPTFWSGFYDAVGMDGLAKDAIQYPALIESLPIDIEDQ